MVGAHGDQQFAAIFQDEPRAGLVDPRAALYPDQRARDFLLVLTAARVKPGLDVDLRRGGSSMASCPTKSSRASNRATLTKQPFDGCWA